MTTAIDTNVLVALWDRDPILNTAAQLALDAALALGGLVISGPVFAELLACPGRDEAFLDGFFRQSGIQIEWDSEESIWRTAGKAFQAYATRRRRHGASAPCRILADFLIGSHALIRGYRLLSLDDRLYRAAFPSLHVISI